MRKIFIILNLLIALSIAGQSYSQVVPEKIDNKTCENSELINKLAEEAFKNIPLVPENIKKNAIDPEFYIVQEFYKNIESGTLEYGKEYDFGANKKIKLFETTYTRNISKEIFEYSKYGTLSSYSIKTNKEVPYIKYIYTLGNWKLDTVIINAKDSKTFSFDSNGKLLAEPDFGPFMKDLQKKIKNNWHPPKDQQTKRIVILFKLDRYGNLSQLKIKESSGDIKSDDASIKAVKISAPFNPLPTEYKGNDIDIQFTFDYKVFSR